MITILKSYPIKSTKQIHYNKIAPGELGQVLSIKVHQCLKPAQMSLKQTPLVLVILTHNEIYISHYHIHIILFKKEFKSTSCMLKECKYFCLFKVFLTNQNFSGANRHLVLVGILEEQHHLSKCYSQTEYLQEWYSQMDGISIFYMSAAFIGFFRGKKCYSHTNKQTVTLFIQMVLNE